MLFIDNRTNIVYVHIARDCIAALIEDKDLKE
jgi:hypothetical protein